jgi:hypothetical protein
MKLKDISNLGLVSEMLNETTYWEIIEKSLRNASNEEEQQTFLVTEISKLSPKEIVGFRLRTDKLLYDTYSSEMWCAGYIMNEGCSDDGFEYFRNWVISKGKEVYYKAKENPDSLVTQIYPGIDFYEFEEFWYVALEAFRTVTTKELYDYIDTDKFKTREGHYLDFEFNWNDEDIESMRAICPKLLSAVWGK